MAKYEMKMNPLERLDDCSAFFRLLNLNRNIVRVICHLCPIHIRLKAFSRLNKINDKPGGPLTQSKWEENEGPFFSPN